MKPFVIGLLIALPMLGDLAGSHAACADIGGAQEGAGVHGRMPTVLKTLPLEVAAMDLDRVHGEIVASVIRGNESALVRISTRTLELTATAGLPPLVGGNEMVVDPRSGRVFLSGGFGLWVLDRDGTIVMHHQPENDYVYLAIDVRRGQVYAVRNQLPRWGTAARLDIISVDTGEVIATQDYLSSYSQRPVIDPFRGTVWIANSNDDSIMMVDPDTYEISYVVPLPGQVTGPAGYHVIEQSIAIVPRARRAYQLANEFSNDAYSAVGIVRVFDLDRGVELEPISLVDLGYRSFSVERIAANQSNSRLYISMKKVNGLSDPTVVVVDPDIGTLREIKLPSRYDIRHIAVDERRRRILVPAVGLTVYNQVLVLDATTNIEQLLGEIQLDAQIEWSAVLDRRTGRYFVATSGGLVVVGDRAFSSSLVY